ncbi:MAG TPA: DUF3078 domain-containing protein [Chitinophagaceae bacterium]|nr:DUF3078 domain-containing protein [Chitinophagaceae bacterium]
MKKILWMTVLLSCLICTAQDETVKKLQAESGKNIKKDPADTSTRNWKKGGLYSLNVSQGSLSNWAAGGDNFSLSVNSLLNLFAFYKKGKHSWDNSFDFNLGYVNTTSLGSRKNDDRFDLLSKYGYTIAPKLNIAGLVNLRSQIFKGYTFPDNIKTFASDFMAPGYILLSAGLDYKPVEGLSIFISPATARWVIVRDTVLSNRGLYGVKPGEKSILEFGAFLTVNYLKEFNKNLTYKGRLDLFSNYRKNPQNIDLFMSNALNIKLSRVLSATWGLDLIYDDDVRLFGDNNTSAGLQVKSLVGLGLLVKF